MAVAMVTWLLPWLHGCCHGYLVAVGPRHMAVEADRCQATAGQLHLEVAEVVTVGLPNAWHGGGGTLFIY